MRLLETQLQEPILLFHEENAPNFAQKSYTFPQEKPGIDIEQIFKDLHINDSSLLRDPSHITLTRHESETSACVKKRTFATHLNWKDQAAILLPQSCKAHEHAS